MGCGCLSGAILFASSKKKKKVNRKFESLLMPLRSESGHILTMIPMRKSQLDYMSYISVTQILFRVVDPGPKVTKLFFHAQLS